MENLIGIEKKKGKKTYEDETKKEEGKSMQISVNLLSPS
jgi:hypothetical protein